MNEPPNDATLGIIGGLGIGATLHFYPALIEACTARGFVPRLFVAHADVDRVLTLVKNNQLSELAAYLAAFADDLAAAGAMRGAIASVTPHVCFDDIQARTNLPLVSILDETARAVAARGLKRVALFGTRFTMESRFFGALDGVDIAQPGQADMDCIHNSYVTIVKAARGSPELESGLRRLAHQMCDRHGAEAIVLAGTELSLVFNETNIDFPVIDCAKLHIEGIVREMMGSSSALSD